MRTKLAVAIAIVSPFLAASAHADAGNLPPSPSQDSLTIQYGYACTPYPGCEYGAGWSIEIPGSTLDLVSWGFAIDPTDIADPSPGVPFADLTTITELITPNAACDATTSEFVCDLEILGLYTNGAPLPDSSLPFYAQEQADQAMFTPLAVQAPVDPPADPPSVPEPATLSLLGLGILTLIAQRRKSWGSF
jgi:PEP-CTERM motif